MYTNPKPAESESVLRDVKGQTDISFWDAQWNHRAGHSFAQHLLHCRDFGRNGIFLRVLKRHVGMARLHGASIVEFGGATSRFLLDLALFAHASVTAVDFSPVGIEGTRVLFERYGVRGTAVHADMFSWDVADGSFDVATHWGLLEHFDDPGPVLAASARVTKLGGLVVFSMPNMAAIGAQLWKRFAPDNYSKHVFHSDDAVADACKCSGLELEKVFHTGPPLVRMAPLERSGLGPLAVNAAHGVACVVGTVAPALYARGHAALSNTRGFVARRVS